MNKGLNKKEKILLKEITLLALEHLGESLDWNKVAKEVAKAEGKKKQVDIAQIKEILKIIRDKLF